MTSFHENLDMYVGILLILCSLCILLFPPKFGNTFYGIFTKQTKKNETVWAIGQKLFALSIITIGAIYVMLGNLKFHNDIPNIAKLMLLYGLWMISKFIVDNILKRKYLLQ
ncbi:MAG TPA: SdpI family protein [Puia sp.]|nr:SdpI family protein [Puia sp.]